MAFTVDYDHDRRRLVVTFSGSVSKPEWVAMLAKQIEEGFWQYGVLFDGTAAGVSLRFLEPGSILRTVRELISEHGPRGPVAFAVSDRAEFALMAGYIQTIQAARLYDVEIFRDLDDAERWLDAKLARRAAK